MNVSLPALVAIFVAVFGAGGLATVAITAWVGKGGRRADVAQKLETVAGKWVERADERVDKVIAENGGLRLIIVDLLVIIEEAASTDGMDPEQARQWRAGIQGAHGYAGLMSRGDWEIELIAAIWLAVMFAAVAVLFMCLF